MKKTKFPLCSKYGLAVQESYYSPDAPTDEEIELALSKAYEQGKLDQSFSLRKKTLEKKLKTLRAEYHDLRINRNDTAMFLKSANEKIEELEEEVERLKSQLSKSEGANRATVKRKR